VSAPGIVADGTGSTLDEGVQTLLFLATMLLAWVGVTRLRNTGFPRLPRLIGWVAAVLAGVALVAAFVVPPRLRPTIAAIRPSTSARLHILSPRAGQVFRGDPAQVPVRLQLIGGRIVNITSTRLIPNEGHIHLFLDGSLVTMSYSTSQTLPLSPGTHHLVAEFVAVDHGPFNPQVLTGVAFRVVPG
jgi:hypothetical protein